MKTEPCAEWRDLIGPLAIGRLDPEESKALSAHLLGCAACRGEARDLRAVAAMLGHADLGSLEAPPVEAPPFPEVLLERIRDAEPIAPHPAIRVKPGRGAASGDRRGSIGASPNRARRWVAALVAAALAAAGVVVGVRLADGGRAGLTDVRKVAFASDVAGVEASAVVTSKEAEAQMEIVLRIKGAPPGQYQISFETRDGAVVPAGKPFGAPSGSWYGARKAETPPGDVVAVKVVQVGGAFELSAQL